MPISGRCEAGIRQSPVSPPISMGAGAEQGPLSSRLTGGTQVRRKQRCVQKWICRNAAQHGLYSQIFRILVLLLEYDRSLLCLPSSRQSKQTPESGANNLRETAAARMGMAQIHAWALPRLSAQPVTATVKGKTGPRAQDAKADAAGSARGAVLKVHLMLHVLVLTLHQCSPSCLHFQRCSTFAGRSSEATQRSANAEGCGKSQCTKTDAAWSLPFLADGWVSPEALQASPASWSMVRLGQSLTHRSCPSCSTLLPVLYGDKPVWQICARCPWLT